jgi:inner membrane transporter RhtA
LFASLSKVFNQIPPWSLALGAMFSIQIGAALSIPLAGTIGVAGTSWLRLSFGALIFLLIARPNLKQISSKQWPLVIGLGLSTGVMTTSFLAAIERIPLGTAVAIEFLGPLTVAALGSKTARALMWPVLAFAGVLLLTEPWKAEVDWLGIGFAFSAAICWGLYIILTQKVGDNFSGVRGLAISIPIAAIATATIGIPSSYGSITPQVLLIAFGLALLVPVIPFTLELLALRKMKSGPFGTLMSVEPAIALLIGLLLLLQTPTLIQLSGIALVVSAGIFSQKNSGR